MNNKYALPKEGGLVLGSTPRDILRRYERVRTTVCESEYEGVTRVADVIVKAIRNYNEIFLPNEIYEDQQPFVLGLTTGRTPLGLYRELLRRYEAGEVSFKNVAIFSLDEFYPIDPSEAASRNYRIREELLNHIDILPENIHMPDSTIREDRVSAHCDSYDKAARKIDLMIIGIGEDGQIGFNEPGSYVKSTTRVVKLTHNTRMVQSKSFFGLEHTPRMAITMGIQTIMRAERIILMAWGEEKAPIIRRVVEGEISPQVPASYLQEHTNIEVVIDEHAASLLSRTQTPWLVGPCEWTPKFTRKAVVWLCNQVQKPILKLTYKDYIDHSLGELLEQGRTYDQINISVFSELKHTITGWPGGKPNADDLTRPVSANPFPKRVLIFSPHPDDDVMAMGGTLMRLAQQGNDVHVAYQTSGGFGVDDSIVIQCAELMRELGQGDCCHEMTELIAAKQPGAAEPQQLSAFKGAIRRSEARAAVRVLGLEPDRRLHFLNLPFYEQAGVKKNPLTEADVEPIVALLREVQPHQIYAAGDLADPHGTHRLCLEALLGALEQTADDAWRAECHLWLYRGGGAEWDLAQVDMAVPLSPDELMRKRHAICRYISQKGADGLLSEQPRELWQRAEERNMQTAEAFDKLGLPEYQAIEVFLRLF
ncbi:MAG: glucosamine-6-phosphate deaminase [Alistipes sp.]|nr:glucosamine-6-phosphate deaminase [Alistipes sp.]